MRMVAVTGGKGGTGKSTIATALAAELGKKKKVLLVDMDVDCPNDHLLLNIKRKKVKKIFQRIPEWNYSKCIKCGKCGGVCKTHAIVSIKGKKPIFIPTQCNGCGACKISCLAKAISWSKKEIGSIYGGKGKGVDFLSGELKVKEPLSELVVSEVKKMIKAEKYDYVLIDTAAGTHCDVISALRGSNIVLAVTEPTPLGAHDLELIISLTKKLGLGFEIILNKEGEGKSESIEGIAEKNGKKIFARIPYKKEIMESYSKGIPIKEKSIERMREWIEK